MAMQGVRLLDPSGAVLATARVSCEGGRFGGSIDLRDASPPLRALFDEFEEVVNGQMFSFLDDIQDRIGSTVREAAFDDGSVRPVSDLQVYPRTGDISFRCPCAD